MEKIALQLYSIKELCQVDFFGTLKKVADIGYEGVEFAGYFEKPARELKKVLDSTGLKVAGSHVGIDMLKDDLAACIDYAHTIENQYIICPHLPEGMRDSADAYKRTAELFNRIGEKCRENAIDFGYHNHDFEFLKFDGEYGLDLLINQTSPEHLFIELDTFWVEFMNLSAVDVIKKHEKRCKILHIKDMSNRLDKKNTEIGKGVLDFKTITNAGKSTGTDWYIVEQEEFTIPQLQSIEVSLNGLRGILEDN